MLRSTRLPQNQSANPSQTIGEPVERLDIREKELRADAYDLGRKLSSKTEQEQEKALENLREQISVLNRMEVFSSVEKHFWKGTSRKGTGA